MGVQFCDEFVFLMTEIKCVPVAQLYAWLEWFFIQSRIRPKFEERTLKMLSFRPYCLKFLAKNWQFGALNSRTSKIAYFHV